MRFYWRIVICCFYIHTKKPNDYDSNFFIIIHCEITHKKEYLSICARNWSLNMHSHKIDSLHFISTYTLNSRDGGAIWDGWDMSQYFFGNFCAFYCFVWGYFSLIKWLRENYFTIKKFVPTKFSKLLQPPSYYVCY